MIVIKVVSERYKSEELAVAGLDGVCALPSFLAGYVDSKENRVVSFHADDHPDFPLSQGQERVKMVFDDLVIERFRR